MDKKLRMFWACSHTMLRLSEIPLFLDLGFELIPTEVTPHVMTAMEASTYDDRDHPINRLWQAATSLPDTTLAALRRSRLWERDGHITRKEIDIFNQYVDVIYVPTRLQLAVEIAKWFKGVIIFRYFGDLDVGKEYLLKPPDGDLPILRRMIFLPIFKSLMRERIASFFDHAFVLHNYLDENTVPRRWEGFQKNSPALIVLSSIHQYIPYQNLLRDLFGLAQSIPIRILGKNTYSQIPADIRKAYEIIVNLKRDEFFEQFFKCQFLIYPHAKRNHSHNVPIEAIYGAMPIVFRTRTPTFIENTHPPTVKLQPAKVGAARSERGLMRLARQAYNNEPMLQNLAKEQRRLTDPYKIESVQREGKALADFIKAACPRRYDADASLINTLTPMGSFPAAAYFNATQNVVENDFRSPFHHFLANHLLNQVEEVTVGSEERFGFHFKQRANHYQFVLGIVPGHESVYFDPEIDHHFTLEFFASGKGRLEVVWEIFVNNEQKSRQLRTISIYSQTRATKIEKFDLRYSEPFHVALYIAAKGNCEVHGGDISHTVSAPETHTINSKLPRSLRHLFIFPFDIDEPVISPVNRRQALAIINGRPPLQIISGCKIICSEGAKFFYSFFLHSISDEPIKVKIDYWQNEDIVEATHHVVKPNTHHMIDDRIDKPYKHVMPVIYIYAESADVYFESLRILGRAARRRGTDIGGTSVTPQ